MIKTFSRYFLRALAFLFALFLMSKLFPSYFGMIEVQAKNNTLVPSNISFMKDGENIYQTFDIDSFHENAFPDINFYGYYQVVWWNWRSVKWTVPNSYSGDFDLSFIYTGNWLINTDNPLTFAVKQGSSIFPCDNSNTWNSQSYKDLTNVYCPNVSLTGDSFQIILAFDGPAKTTKEKDSVGISRINLFQSGFSSLEQQQKEIENTLKDSNTDGASSSGNSFFNDFDEGSEGDLTDLVSLPLNFINHLNDKCQPFTLPMGNMGTVTIPCLSSLWSSSSFSNIINIAKIILNGIICYKVGLNLLMFFKDLKDPDKDKLEVMDL